MLIVAQDALGSSYQSSAGSHNQLKAWERFSDQESKVRSIDRSHPVGE
jgi:hypothetical protein